jgi:HrpA-like RNA helicase
MEEPLPPISLLRKGFVKYSKFLDAKEKKRIDNTVALDYIMEFLKDRISPSRGRVAKIIPKSYGEKVVLIKAGTSSGKSTAIPSALYKNFFDTVKKNTIITQPRIINTVDIALGLPEFYDFLEFGKNLGYQTGPFTKKGTDKGLLFINIDSFYAVITSMTDEDILKNYQFIVIDEVHVSEVAMDVVLYKFKNFLTDNWQDPECPIVILMSATIEEISFMDYFEIPKRNFLYISGISNKIYVNYPEYSPSNYMEYAMNKAFDINKNEDPERVRDIIMFVAGASDTKVAISLVDFYNSELYSSAEPVKRYILPVSLTSESFKKGGIEYQDIYSNIELIKVPIYKSDEPGKVGLDIITYVSPFRRCIISTNVAETGVTLPTLKYCIDTGWSNSSEFNPEIGSYILLKKNITKGSAIQRKGRVGRKAVGHWYPCYTEDTFNKFRDENYSKIITSDVSNLLLNYTIDESGAKLEPVVDDVKSTPLLKYRVIRGESVSHRQLINLRDQFRKDTESFTKMPSYEYSQVHSFMIHSFADKTKYNLVYNSNSVDMKNMAFMTLPPSRSLLYSCEKLYMLGMIDQNYLPTLLGYVTKSFKKISIENIRMLLAGYQYGCNIIDLVTIVAFLQIGMAKGINYTQREVIGNGHEAQFFNKLIIGDDLIDYIFLWDEVVGFFDKKKKNVMEEFIEMCEKNSLNYIKVFDVCILRDEIITNMLDIGLNPFYNGLDLPRGSYNLKEIFRRNIPEGSEQVLKIKKAIRDGYRLNIAKWSESSRTYVFLHRKHKVAVTGELVKYKRLLDGYTSVPEYIIVPNPIVSKTLNGYEFHSGESISILDGFCSFDGGLLYE